MPSRIKSDRTHMDKSVLAHCPDLQSIPLNKPQLAAIAGGKVFRPQQAAYMFENLPVSQARKEALLSEFVERSMKTKPITIPAHQYGTRTTDHLSLVPTATRPTPATQTEIANAATQTINSPAGSVTGSVTNLSSAGSHSDDVYFGRHSGGDEFSRRATLDPNPDDYGYEPDVGEDGPNDHDDASAADTDDEGEGALIHPSNRHVTHSGLLVPFPFFSPLRITPHPPTGTPKTANSPRARIHPIQ